MKIFSPALAAFTAFVFFACTGLPSQKADLPPERADPLPQRANLPPQRADLSPEGVPETVPSIPERFGPPVYIMGKGSVRGENMAEFLMRTNNRADRDFVRSLSSLYVEEASVEGVNHDIAFAQMCLETGFLRYGGLVTPDKNNFCGLGAIGPEQPGLTFPDPRTGVRAHIQHLKAYATEEPLKLALVDPRYRYVKLGSSPAIHGLAGTWAADLAYAGKIENILKRLYDFSF